MEFDFSTFHTIVMRFSLFFIAAALMGDLVRPFCFFSLNLFIFFFFLQSSIRSIYYIINYVVILRFTDQVVSALLPPSHLEATKQDEGALCQHPAMNILESTAKIPVEPPIATGRESHKMTCKERSWT